MLRGAGPRDDVVVEVGRQPSWVRAAVAALPEAHWVFVSSISVYADHPARVAGRATCRCSSRSPADRRPGAEPEAYGGMKVACERIVRPVAAASTHLAARPDRRPRRPDGRFTYWPDRLADAADGDPVLAPGSPQDPVQVVDVRDLAAFVVHCAEVRSVEVLDAVGPVVAAPELLEQVADGVGAHRVTSPGCRLARLVELGVAEWAGPASLPLWLAGDDHAGMLAHDPDPAVRAGLVARPVAETAAATLAWVREVGAEAAGLQGLSREQEDAVLAGRKA